MTALGYGGSVSFERNPERVIPAVDVPSLGELGVEGSVAARTWTRLLFASRPFAGAIVIAGFWMQGWWLFALALFPALYGSSLTIIHHMIHGSLGFGRRQRTVLMTAVSLLLLESGHALERTHLQHHGTDPDAEDPEGYIESLGWDRLLVEAPLFRYRLWTWAHRNPGVGSGRATAGRSIDRLRVLEMVWHGVATAVAVVVAAGHALGWFGAGRLAWGIVAYVATQHLANAVFAVLAAKGPHTNWGRSTPSPLIAVRGRVTQALLFGHIWHLEHHLYPEVPLPHLKRVARRVEPLIVDRGALVVTTI